MPRIPPATLVAFSRWRATSPTGGSSANSNNPPQLRAPPTLVLRASVDQTLAGGKAVALSSSTAPASVHAGADSVTGAGLAYPSSPAA